MNNHRFKSSAASYLSAILLTGATFTAACDSAAPPRAIVDSANSASAQREQKPVPARDQKAIESVSNVPIMKLSGGAFKLSDFLGKVLVVDFWATYCPPCVRQVPRLAELSRKYRDKGLEVIGLTSDDKADRKSTRLNSSHLGISYAVFCLKKKKKKNKTDR